MQMFAWRLGDQIWSPEFIIQDWAVLSYSYKWLFTPTSVSKALTPKEAIAYDDKRLIKEVHDIFNEADVIIAHNGDKFDLPKMNTRFLYHGLPPTSPYLTIDTRATAKKAFGFTSNKLAYLAKYLGLNPKMETDFALWRDCVKGDPKAIEYMRKYNEQDIFTLEDVYVCLRPWIRHPNFGLFMSLGDRAEVCPRCGSDHIEWGDKYTTPAGVFDSFRCNNCGGRGRASKRDSTIATRSI